MLNWVSTFSSTIKRILGTIFEDDFNDANHSSWTVTQTKNTTGASIIEASDKIVAIYGTNTNTGTSTGPITEHEVIGQSGDFRITINFEFDNSVIGEVGYFRWEVLLDSGNIIYGQIYNNNVAGVYLGESCILNINGSYIIVYALINAELLNSTNIELKIEKIGNEIKYYRDSIQKGITENLTESGINKTIFGLFKFQDNPIIPLSVGNINIENI